jgi:hypothetical protein
MKPRAQAAGRGRERSHKIDDLRADVVGEARLEPCGRFQEDAHADLQI